MCVCVCLRRQRGAHQISCLIWAASGEVKGAVGRLSSPRRKKKRRNQDGVSVKGDEKEGEEESEKNRGE